jgi:hypothetical protein
MKKQAMWMVTAGALVLGGCGSDDAQGDSSDHDDHGDHDDHDHDTHGGDGTGDAGGGGTGAGDAGSGGTGAGDSTCPEGLYALATSVPSGSDSNSMYVAVRCGLGSGELSFDDALEFPGGGRIYTYPEEHAVFIHSFEQETVTRVDVDSEGMMRLGMSFSLANYGGSFANLNHFISPTKAMFFDVGTSRVIVWNPREMEITGDIDLPFSPEDGAHPGFSGDIQVRAAEILADGRLLIPLWWPNWDTMRLWTGFSALLVDPVTDTVDLAESTDSECPATLYVERDKNGDLVFAADPWSLAFVWSGQEDLPHSCALRAPSALDDLANLSVLDLRPSMGGRIGGGLAITESGVAYTTAYYPQAGDAVEDIFERFNAGDAWKLWRFHLDEDSAGEEVAGIPPGAGNVPFFRFGNRLYVNVDVDDTNQIFYELVDDGPAVKGLSVPGDWLIGVGRVGP